MNYDNSRGQSYGQKDYYSAGRNLLDDFQDDFEGFDDEPHRHKPVQQQIEKASEISTSKGAAYSSSQSKGYQKDNQVKSSQHGSRHSTSYNDNRDSDKRYTSSRDYNESKNRGDYKDDIRRHYDKHSHSGRSDEKYKGGDEYRKHSYRDNREQISSRRNLRDESESSRGSEKIVKVSGKPVTNQVESQNIQRSPLTQQQDKQFQTNDHQNTTQDVQKTNGNVVSSPLEKDTVQIDQGIITNVTTTTQLHITSPYDTQQPTDVITSLSTLQQYVSSGSGSQEHSRPRRSRSRENMDKTRDSPPRYEETGRQSEERLRKHRQSVSPSKSHLEQNNVVMKQERTEDEQNATTSNRTYPDTNAANSMNQELFQKESLQITNTSSMNERIIDVIPNQVMASNQIKTENHQAFYANNAANVYVTDQPMRKVSNIAPQQATVYESTRTVTHVAHNLLPKQEPVQPPRQPLSALSLVEEEKTPAMSLDENINSYFMLGVPVDKKGDVITEAIRERNLAEPCDWDLIKAQDAFGVECKYIKFAFNDDAVQRAFQKVHRAISLDPCLKLGKQNILIVPYIPNVPIETIIAQHQVAFRLPNLQDYKDVQALCARAYYEDITDLRRETTALFNFFNDHVGEVVDMNLDYFPEMIVVTFAKSSQAQRTFESFSLNNCAFNFISASSREPRAWIFEPTKVDFTCRVRNCSLADESPPNKYIPIYVQKEKLQQVAKFIDQHRMAW